MRTAWRSPPVRSTARRLMENAGSAVAALVLARHPGAARIDVLCGPGNNGGDGYVVAAAAGAERASTVEVVGAGAAPRRQRRRKGGRGLSAEAAAVADFRARRTAPSWSTRSMEPGFEGRSRATLPRRSSHCNAAGVEVVAVDLPSGVSGLTGQVLGTAFRATQTVTFVRRKPGHCSCRAAACAAR